MYSIKKKKKQTVCQLVWCFLSALYSHHECCSAMPNLCRDSHKRLVVEVAAATTHRYKGKLCVCLIFLCVFDTAYRSSMCMKLLTRCHKFLNDMLASLKKEKLCHFTCKLWLIANEAQCGIIKYTTNLIALEKL